MNYNNLLTKKWERKAMFFLLSFVLSLNAFAQNFGARAEVPMGNSFANGRQGPISFSLNNKVYVGSGYGGAGHGGLSDLWEYNPANNSWAEKKSVPNASRTFAVAFTINGKAYAGMGVNNFATSSMLALADFYEYDPATDKWTAKANFPPGGRFSMAAFVLNGKGYVLGGQNAQFTKYPELWEYDPLANTWTQKASYPAAHITYPYAFSIGSKAYVACGGTSASNYTKDTYEYDALADTWTKKADFPGTGREGGSVFVIGTKAYCGLGTTYTSFFSDFYVYDGSANTWSPSTAFPGPVRANATATSTGTKGYIAAGWSFLNSSSNYYKDFYEFPFVQQTGIREENEVEFSCYPNPSSDLIQLHSTEILPGKEYGFKIYNSIGAIIKSGETINHSIDVSTLSNASYFIEINAEATLRTRIIKM